MTETNSVPPRRVWDLPVRVFHWALVASILGAFVTNRLGVSWFGVHVWFGYGVIVLVTFRILWGLVGTRHALFWNFVRGPVHTVRYAFELVRGEARHYAGHNPLGALMVVALLVLLAAQASFGLFGDDEIVNTGPLNGYVGHELALVLTSLHRRLFWVIAGAAVLHVAAVAAHRLFKGENLVKAMITGHKRHHHLTDDDHIHSSRTWLAVALVAVLAFGLGWVVTHAPQPSGELASSFM